jgi:hypothetical protein
VRGSYSIPRAAAALTAVLAALWAPALAGAENQPSPPPLSGISQYVEQVPTAEGTANVEKKPAKPRPLPPNVRRALNKDGGSDAAALTRIANSGPPDVHPTPTTHTTPTTVTEPTTTQAVTTTRSATTTTAAPTTTRPATTTTVVPTQSSGGPTKPKPKPKPTNPTPEPQQVQALQNTHQPAVSNESVSAVLGAADGGSDTRLLLLVIGLGLLTVATVATALWRRRHRLGS